MGGNGRKTAGGGLTARQERGLAALLHNATIDAAAKAAKIGNTTLRTWLADADFRAAYDQARRAVYDQAIATAQNAAGAAVATLVLLMAKGTPQDSVRLAAARAILAIGDRQDIEEIKRRIAALEALQERVRR